MSAVIDDGQFLHSRDSRFGRDFFHVNIGFHRDTHSKEAAVRKRPAPNTVWFADANGIVSQPAECDLGRDGLSVRDGHVSELASGHPAACPAPSHTECPAFQWLLKAAASGAIENQQKRPLLALGFETDTSHFAAKTAGSGTDADVGAEGQLAKIKYWFSDITGIHFIFFRTRAGFLGWQSA